MLEAGHLLRALREQLHLTVRDVEAASSKLANRHRNPEFAISISRLSDIETKGILPSIYKIYTLAAIYRRSFADLLAWYGIDLANASQDAGVLELPHSHLLPAAEGGAIKVPVRLDPAFDPRKTTNIGRMIQSWGLVPLTHLAAMADSDFTFGYIGTGDLTMYPLLLPGSFVQVDEARNQVEEKLWRSEYERPIYFVEGRDGFVCCWCSVKGEKIILQPHPLSPVQPRILRYPQEAEVVGQVVGVAMRLGDVTLDDAPRSPARPKLN
ncbi:MAG: helix-turn-helix transcriptional regulator [Candidatus Koribacter versatilis]|uniref:Helix-turn-helix transcriptional regulator n=1 Tax=Candidatus Korobacter versatilis TaxID=658062 RepID=A0A932A7M2_9BACT|nr:helix-turn-helix transcriptional regulator [Candidatus Koribacter versatilis]